MKRQAIPNIQEFYFDLTCIYGNMLNTKVTMSICLSVQNSCPVHICLVEKHWKLLLNTNIAYDMTEECVMTLTQCHMGKVKVTRMRNAKFVSYLYRLYWEILEVSISCKESLWPENMSWTKPFLKIHCLKKCWINNND